MCACISSLLLHGFIRDFIRNVYLGQVIYNIEANISQATKSAYSTVIDVVSGTRRCVVAVVTQSAEHL